MKVSIIIPVYNVENYLVRCLDSIIKQSYTNLEIILVDDGSTDSCYKICDDYATKDNRILVFHLENHGAATARNFGVEKATGEYLFFVDSDDYIENDSIEKMLKLSNNGEKDIIYCDYNVAYSNDLIEKRKLIPFSISNNKAHILAIPAPWGRLIKRSFYIKCKVKFLEGKCFEDNAIMPLVSALANSYNYLEEPKYYYFQREGSALNNSYYNSKWEDIFEVLEYLYQGFVNKGLFDKYRDELEFIYIEYLLHAANLRFIKYKEGIKNIKLVTQVLKKKFPNWRKNTYYKQTSIKYKIVCNLFYYNHITLLKMILRRKHI